MSRKTRIEDFLKSVGEVKDVTDVVLVGGAANNPDGTLATTNKSNCTNITYDGCNKSKNYGDCKNATNMCNNSTNGGECNNAYQIPDLTNMTVESCKKP